MVCGPGSLQKEETLYTGSERDANAAEPLHSCCCGFPFLHVCTTGYKHALRGRELKRADGIMQVSLPGIGCFIGSRGWLAVLGKLVFPLDEKGREGAHSSILQFWFTSEDEHTGPLGKYTVATSDKTFSYRIPLDSRIQ